MATIRRSRGAQYPLAQEFVFNYNDLFPQLAALNSPSPDVKSGVITDFGVKNTLAAGQAQCLSGQTFVVQPNTGANYIEMMSLPNGAQIVSGELLVEAPYVGPSTATLSVGNAQGSLLHSAAVTLKAAALGGSQTGAVSGAHNGQVVTLTVAASHGVAAGNIINVTGVTGAGAACYNGTYVVDAVTSTTIVYFCTALAAAGDAANTAALGAGITDGAGVTWIAGRTALTVNAEDTAGSPSGAGQAAAGIDIRGTLTFSGGQAATQGRVRVRITYTIDGRINEASPN